MSNDTSAGGGRDPHSPSQVADREPGPKWHRVNGAATLMINWGNLLDTGRHIDPYLVWADLTEFAGFTLPDSDSDERKLSFLVELHPDASLELPDPRRPPDHRIDPIWAEVIVPGLYKLPSRGDDSWGPSLSSRFLTLRIAPACVSDLLKSPNVRRAQLGIARINADQTPPPPAPSRIKVPTVVLGIIDDGCPFAHPHLADENGFSRVRYLWDQDRSREQLTSLFRPAARGELEQEPTAGWHCVEAAGYGRELRPGQLRYASHAGQASGSDTLAYAITNYGAVLPEPERASSMFVQTAGYPVTQLPYGTLRRQTHGASALFLAAGSVDGTPPLAAQKAVEGCRPEVGQHIRGGASECPIVFVQLPTRTLLDTSGGSLGVHVLDGVRYILDRAAVIDADTPPAWQPGQPVPVDEKLAERPISQNPVVINISYGAYAGPHDGSSILEQALADLVGCTLPPEKGVVAKASDAARQDLWICLAAGNGHGRRGFARTLVSASRPGALVWDVGPDNPHMSFLEIWLPAADHEGRPVAAAYAHQIGIKVYPPGEAEPVLVSIGQGATWQDEGSGATQVRAPRAGVFYPRSVAQGLYQTMALVAVSPTRPLPGRGQPAPHGAWRIEIHLAPSAGESPGAEAMYVQAWTERDDLVYGVPRKAQNRLRGDDEFPELSETSPSAIAYLKHQYSNAKGGALRDPLAPDPAVGSLSGLATPKQGGLLDASPAIKGLSEAKWRMGGLVVVGAGNLSNEEVASYSSGGPSRHAPVRHAGTDLPTSERLDPELPFLGASRNRPDVTAPADVGPAVRGLRTAGMRAGEWARLSGTSAAAPNVARSLVDLAAASLRQTVEGSDSGSSDDLQSVRSRFLRAESKTGDGGVRETITPIKDDLYRRGDWLLRP